MKGPVLPVFNDEKDDIDAYLRRFEIFATAAKWKKEDWAVSLSSYLTGAALETYSWIPSEDALDYGKVKVALMKRFQCTEEGYRVRFRSAKPLSGEQVG